MRVPLLCLLLTVGCTDYPDVSAEFLRADAHVDPTQPSELARIDVAIRLYNSDNDDHRFGVDHIWVWRDGMSDDLPLALDTPLVDLSGDAWRDVAFVNVRLQNATLAAYCEQSLDLAAHVEVRDLDFAVQTVHARLAVFCP